MMWNTDGDDFQIPPSSSQLSLRKPLRPTNGSISQHHHRPPRKKPRLSLYPGKENIAPPPEFTSSPCLSSGSYAQGSSSSAPDCSLLDCIPSSVDCSPGEPFYSLAAETEDDEVLVGGKEKGECFKANREGYSCNSMEARLLSKSRIRLDEEEDVESDSESELDVLIKLCSEGSSIGRDNDSIQCPLCETDISALSGEQRQVHTNNCLDTQAPQQGSLRKCEKSSSSSSFVIQESVDDPVQLVNDDLSPVLKWVRSLGLAKYEDVFLREEIDWDTLHSLTEEDLLSIGITSLGPRKKIVNALSTLREEACASPADAQAQFLSNSSHVTERQRERSTYRKTSEPKKPTANKLITEFFPGDATKIPKLPKEPVTEQSCRRAAVRRNGNNGKI